MSKKTLAVPLITLALSITFWGVAAQSPAAVTVHNTDELRRAAAAAKPGARILLAPGTYEGGLYFTLKGEPNKPIVIAAADSKNPPVIKGKAECLHLSDCAYVELHNLTLTGATVNGLNVDDSGSYDTPAHHIVLRGLKVTDVGSGGNHDGIKLSGLDDFRVEGCTVERWGSGGSAIDMVGCHHGTIENNFFRHTNAAASSGVQMKGGTSQITVRRNRFENYGSRAVNIGGSTGLQLFRPSLKSPPHAEAKDIRVEGNTFIGGDAPIAFVGVDGAIVRFNTIYRPKRWAMRILQETRDPGFVPCRNGEFTDNIIVFHSTQWFEGGVNIGPNTAPKTFKFARNFWHCLNNPSVTKSLVILPTEETDGVYGKAPLFRDAEKGDLRLQPNSPAKKMGVEAFSQ